MHSISYMSKSDGCKFKFFLYFIIPKSGIRDIDNYYNLVVMSAYEDTMTQYIQALLTSLSSPDSDVSCT